MSYTIAIPRPPSTYDGRTTTGNPIFCAASRASSRDVAVPLAGCGNAEIPQQLRKSPAIFGEVDRVRRRAENPHASGLQRERQLQRRLAAELHEARDVAAACRFAIDHRHDVFERQRLEIQPVGGVVVGRHRLRVAVDHHRLEPRVAQRERRVAAAVVELEPLPDAVRAAAENDDLRLVGRVRLVAPLVRAVHVRRERLELGRAGVDALERRDELLFDAPLANRRLGHAVDGGDLTVAEPRALQRAQKIGRQLAELLHAGDAPQLGDLAELLKEPRIDVRQLVQLLDGPAALERLEERPHAPVVRHDQLLAQRRVVFLFARLRQQQALLAELERSHALEKRLLERAPDRHRLAHRLHLRRQRAIGLRKLLEVPSRNLRHDVVDRRLERRGREPRDVVGNLVEVIAERELGGDLRDRESRRLRRQRRRARDARVHLDDQHAAVVRGSRRTGCSIRRSRRRPC